ncbi:NADH:flavin oxidoreductase/NADH oxidase family protein [Sinimarinibacterium sp. NLF-5-8]|uniref:NADH:flavin oxidoreductase/NADH oxidase family protein n=1 Tax=Sinimarinibacterium sp. NLF-5-8 TaxID=2698684 RepID=UPI00137BD76E|nr:NADH:flavin oxidoreductase/NADH oxidase family protein [Sinimarinibacterium sp. NLF-5-8]QHS09333.1 NADH:flavin oxidoreductase/NADH oxidase family protein [Sinimarinibacterium sp. NLF-5-8]
MSDSLLAQALTLGNGSVLPNRIAKSAMSEGMGTMDNRVTPALVQLYQAWGQGGTGLIITGNVMIDRRALGEPGNVALEDERDMPLLQQWARAATQNGAQCWMQLNHPGRQSPKGLNAETVAPSAVPFRADMQMMFGTPRALTEAEINDLIARFARAAALCKQAGFTGVQIHGAHGYLISQFLSPLTNQRTDQWGGSAENRRRFVLEVLAAMRAAVGADFPIGIKLNSADFQRGGFEEAESLEVMQALADAGIDLIEISGGTYEAPQMTGIQPGQRESTRQREAYFLSFAEKLRARVKTPLMVTGGFRTPHGMNAALASGALDVVGVARQLAIEPDAPLRWLAGQDSRHQVRQQIKTGIPFVDKGGLMEVMWYSRQLKRIGRGKPPCPNESGLASLAWNMVGNMRGTLKTRRLRART